MTRRQRAAERLANGSAAVARRIGAALAAWVARGRRQDLTGLTAALGCWLRLAGLILGGYMIARVVRAVPSLMWLLAGLWLTAAWRAGRARHASADEPPDPAPKSSPDQVYAATLEWVWQHVADKQGVHLRDLLTHAHAHGMHQALDVTALRTVLEQWGIPTRDRVRVRGLGVTVGIHRDDLPAPSSPSPTTPSEAIKETEPHAA